MEATSQIGLEVRTVIGDNLQYTLVGVDVGMNRHRERAFFHARFSYKIDMSLDSMSLEDSKAYAKHCRDGWFELFHHEGEGRGEVCENFYFYLIIIKSCFASLYIYIYIYIWIFKMNSCELQFTQMLKERDFMVNSIVNLGPMKEVHLHKYL